MLGHRPSLRVFLSYTTELCTFPPERTFVAAAEEAIKRSGAVPVSMPTFAVRDQPAAAVCEAEVRGCDIYVLIAGSRYGSRVCNRPEVSYTELEYDTASRAGMPRLVFVLDEQVARRAAGHQYPDDGLLQQRFRDRVCMNLVGQVKDPGQLELRLFQALTLIKPRRASQPLFVGACVLAVLASLVAVAIAASDRWHGISGTAPPVTAATATAPATGSSATSVPPGSANTPDVNPQKLIIDGQVTIPRQAAADVDRLPAAVEGTSVGPVGDLDLFYAAGEIRAQGSAFVPLPTLTPSRTEFVTCDDATGPSSSATAVELSIVPAMTNLSFFCFVTSAHHLAWAQVVGTDAETQAVTVHVRVWEKTLDA